MAEEEQSVLTGIWKELQRRRVIRVTVVYAAAGWVLIEVSSTVMPNLNLPDWTVTLVTVLVVIGFFLTFGLAWAFDIGPGGVHKTLPKNNVGAAAPVPEESAEPDRGHTTDQRRSIAVLPFVNMSGDDENEYFSDGVAEEILNL